MKRTRLSSSACGLAAALAFLILSSTAAVAEGRVNGKRTGGKKAKNYLANVSRDVSSSAGIAHHVLSSTESAHHVFPSANGPLTPSGAAVDILHNDQQAEQEQNEQEQSERKTMKAEQSDVDFTIDNNAGGNNNDNNGNNNKDKDKNNVFGGGGDGNDGVDPDDVQGDPRELPLPGKDADDADGSSGNNGQNGGEDGSDGNDSNNNGGNGGGGQDGQKGGTSDGPTGTGSNGGNGSTLNGGDNINDPGTYGSLQNDGSKGTNGGGADGETDGSGFNTNNADGSSTDKNTPVISVSDPTLSYADTNNDGINDACQTSHDSLFGSEATRPSQTKIVRYTYEVEFVLDDIDSLLGALSNLETALGDQLVPKMFSECQNSGAADGGWSPPSGIEVNSERERARNNQDGQRRRRRVQELEGVVGMSMAPEDKPYPGFPCTVIDPPVEHGCVVMEGQLTLHLSEDADEDEVIDQTQDIIATSMDDNDALLNNIDPVIFDVAYVSDGPFLPATTEVSLRSDGENETQDFPFAVAGGAAAAFVGIMLILLGIKMKRNKNADDDDDSDADQKVDDQDALNSSDLSHDDVVKEIAGGPMAYDMKKLTSPSQLPRGSDDSFESTIPVDGAGNTVLTGTPHGDSTMMSASILGESGDSASANGKLGILPPNDSSIVDMSTSNFLSQSDGSRLLASHDDGKSTTSQSVGAGSHVSLGNSTILNDIV